MELNTKIFGSKVKDLTQRFDMISEITKSVVEEFVRSNVLKFWPNEVTVQVKPLENFKGDLPTYQSSLASGFDVRAQLAASISLPPGERILVPTGLSFAIPKGFEIQARPRSGWAIKEGVSLVNTPGTIDADYRGEVKIILINLGQKHVTINDQDRIAQLVVCPVMQANFVVTEELDSTERGAGGFGSTGKN